MQQKQQRAVRRAAGSLVSCCSCGRLLCTCGAAPGVLAPLELDWSSAVAVAVGGGRSSGGGGGDGAGDWRCAAGRTLIAAEGRGSLCLRPGVGWKGPGAAGPRAQQRWPSGGGACARGNGCCCTPTGAPRYPSPFPILGLGLSTEAVCPACLGRCALLCSCAPRWWAEPLGGFIPCRRCTCGGRWRGARGLV